MATTLGHKKRFVMKDGKVMIEDYVISPEIYKAMGALAKAKKMEKEQEEVASL